MRRHLIVTALLASAATPLWAQWGSPYSEERSAQLDGAGVRVIRVEAAAGRLRITGRTGTSQIDVRGTARANEQRFLEDIRLVAQRRGDEVVIEADIPDNDWRRFRNVERALDLVIDVPAGVRLDVRDGSGEVEISGTGAVDIEDGSGDITIERIAGDVRVEDGSGNVDVRDVEGTVTIESDGSGNLDIADVRGSVMVEDDGSGNISARRVGGSFTVRRDGSGSITHVAVEGSVNLPARWNRSSRSRVRTSFRM